MKHPDSLGMAPVQVDGTTYWISHHAAERALEMGVPLALFERIISNGQWFQPGTRSKYHGCLVVRNGKVSLGVSFRGVEPVVATCVWSTQEDWRAAAHRGGRVYKGDEWTQRALDSWTPIPVTDEPHSPPGDGGPQRPRTRTNLRSNHMSERARIQDQMIAYKGSMTDRYGEGVSFSERLFAGHAFTAGARAAFTLSAEQWEEFGDIIEDFPDADDALTALGFRRSEEQPS